MSVTAHFDALANPWVSYMESREGQYEKFLPYWGDKSDEEDVQAQFYILLYNFTNELTNFWVYLKYRLHIWHNTLQDQ